MIIITFCLLLNLFIEYRPPHCHIDSIVVVYLILKSI